MIKRRKTKKIVVQEKRMISLKDSNEYVDHLMSNLFSKNARKGDIEVPKFDEFLDEKPSDGKIQTETRRPRLS